MANKPSLCFYTNIPTPYQISFFKELSKLFTLRVVFFSITENDRSWQFSLKEDYEIIVLKDNFIGWFFQKWVTDFHFSWHIFKLVWNGKSDHTILMGNYWNPNATIILILSKLRSRKVSYFSEPLYPVNNKLKYYVKWFYLRILNICCNAIFCIGKNATESFNSYRITLPKYMVPYNIDARYFTDLDVNKKAAFVKKYRENNEVVILSSGALVPRKGMDILIDAVKQIDNQNIKLIIIGDGPQKQELIRMCGNDQRIILAGFQNPEDIPYFYAIADIFAFASRYDGWAVVINEAVAANVPVIASDQVGAAVELIRSKDLGILCKSESVVAFRQAIEDLANDKVLRQNIKMNTLKLIPLISSDYNAKRVFEIFAGLPN